MSQDQNKIISSEILSDRIYNSLRDLGYLIDSNNELHLPKVSKEVIRGLYKSQREAALSSESDSLTQNFEQLERYFASGKEVVVPNIRPRLELIRTHTWQARLFKLASLTWSVPVSSGYGRRMRFLVWDDSNGKLMGLMALGDPVFNLAARDKYIGWTGNDRKERLVNVMDAYVLGAVPPYNFLLCGKMIACLARSFEVHREFCEKYKEQGSYLSGIKKSPTLLAVTTSSSLGRSSVYNRLKLNGMPYFSSVGYTGGWGHFHISQPLFLDLCAYLRQIGHTYPESYSLGEGGNWRLRNIRAALSHLGITEDLLRHGVKREVFISELASNGRSILKNGAETPMYPDLLSVSGIAELALERWVLPRSKSRGEFRAWKVRNLMRLIQGKSPVQELNNLKVA